MSWDCFGTLCLAMTKIFRNVVRGFSLVRTTLKGRTTKVVCLAMAALFVIAVSQSPEPFVFVILKGAKRLKNLTQGKLHEGEAWQTGSLKIRRIFRVKSHRWCAA